jgi:hypothetical protein
MDAPFAAILEMGVAFLLSLHAWRLILRADPGPFGALSMGYAAPRNLCLNLE